MSGRARWPVPSQVLARGSDGCVELDLPAGAELRVDGVPSGHRLPTGGPYRLEAVTSGGTEVAHDVLVGDVWLLAGQSNLVGVSEPGAPLAGPRLARSGGYAGRWAPAVPPLHRFWEQPGGPHWCAYRDQVHRLDEVAFRQSPLSQPPAVPPQRHVEPAWGFAQELSDHGVPVGLLPLAVGGSALSMWEPGTALYDDLVVQARRYGPVKSLVWYQGEGDATVGALTASYLTRWSAMVTALREALGQPALPVVVVQLGPVDRSYYDALGHVMDVGLDEWWGSVREQQRQAADITGVQVVTAADLQLHDGIHLDAATSTRLGRRLGRVALGLAPEWGSVTTPRLDAVLPTPTGVLLRVSGANGSLRVTGPCDLTVDGVPARDVTVVDATTVRVEVGAPAGRGAVVRYALGPLERLGLHDDEDLPLPAFGPVVVTPAAESRG